MSLYIMMLNVLCFSNMLWLATYTNAGISRTKRKGLSCGVCHSWEYSSGNIVPGGLWNHGFIAVLWDRKAGERPRTT